MEELYKQVIEFIGEYRGWFLAGGLVVLGGIGLVAECFSGEESTKANQRDGGHSVLEKISQDSH